ncbi:MAG TPA: XRE family transcriptional regulator [Arthrobacter sp.]
MTQDPRTQEVDAPVEEWGAERLRAAIEHGSRADWDRMCLALETDPRGKVAGELEDVLAVTWPSAAAETLRRVGLSALAHAEAMERGELAAQLQGIFAGTGLSITRFAERLGVTEARASTYLGGTEVPPADLMARAAGLAG